jgi:hypothetical protein
MSLEVLIFVSTTVLTIGGWIVNQSLKLLISRLNVLDRKIGLVEERVSKQEMQVLSEYLKRVDFDKEIDRIMDRIK